METKFAKILMTLAICGFMVWFGGSFLRSAIAYDLFIPTENFQLKDSYSDVIRMHSVYMFSTLAAYTNISYGISLVSVLIFILLVRKELKAKGWLFMSILLFLLASPIEIIKIYYDAKLSWAIYYDNVRDFYNPIISEYFIERFKNITMNTMSSLSLLANFTIIFFMIWKPLDKSN